MNRSNIVIIGAGPAGLTAAYELVKHGIRPIVLEKSDQVGGISRTEVHDGYRFDIGGHRFYTRVKEVEQAWHAVLGDEFRRVRRLSRIYYAGKFFNYPIDIANALTGLGPVQSTRVLLSYLGAQLKPHAEENTFEEWVSNRFGRHLYQIFFKTYTEKVWGIPCNQIRADWAAQRIKGLSLKTAISNALFGANGVTSLIHEFYYPQHGPGMMWESFRDFVEEHDGQVWCNSEVTGLEHVRGHVTYAYFKRDTQIERIATQHVISSMPLTTLMKRLSPPPPTIVLQAAAKLEYRAFLIVGLIVDHPDLFPDNWIYIHTPHFKVGRIQNFKNWSPDLVPDPRMTSLGMEYFCWEGDQLWQRSDDDLIALATRELEELGLTRGAKVTKGIVIRQPKAYPVYNHNYRSHLATIQDFLKTSDNLQTIGRNGMHRYNNQDHSMLTGLLAARNILGENHDLWRVNTERSYYEEFESNSIHEGVTDIS